PRSKNPFINVSCAALPDSLIESELFGYEKGAFTGATARKKGRFERAERGTLFLDEIGDMPLDAQTRLLRVLQEGEFTTVGGRTPIKANVRIVTATHRDLAQQVSDGRFREDLFYRLNVVPMRLPPLRERTEDIPDLVRHFLRALNKEGLPQKSIERAALDRLQAHRWPGNVRELENLVQRLAALYSQDVITREIVESELADISLPPAQKGDSRDSESLSEAVERHLTEYFAAHGNSIPPPGIYDRVLREVERPLIAITLASVRGNQVKASDLLGLNRNTLRKKIRDLGIDVVKRPV
ncbi:MAG: sigma 54-interacting transcriptional regulator, partial [Proteobacteria bacterium]|nr:sigma 54-interacting transcriptional regulator [Pseudomonadota bacterium]